MSTDPIRLGYLFAEIVSGHDVSRFDEIVAPAIRTPTTAPQNCRSGCIATIGIARTAA